MDEIIFFAIIGIIFVAFGFAFISKCESIVRNLYSNRRRFPNIFKNIKNSNDRMISEKEKIHGKHICYFMGLMFILFGLLSIFLKVIF